MKRSAHVALLLMGVGGVGAGAYAMAPLRNNCVPQSAPPSVVVPNPSSASDALQPCPPRHNGGTGGGYYRSWSNWSAPIYNHGGTTSAAPAAGRSASVGTSFGTGVARGGFGATGHSASASG